MPIEIYAENLLDCTNRFKARIAIENQLYLPTSRMLDAMKHQLVVQNNKLKNTNSSAFVYDLKTYMSSNVPFTGKGKGTWGDPAPVLHGSLRNELKYYISQKEEVDKEQADVKNFLLGVLMSASSRDEILSYLPESIHSALSFLQPHHFYEDNHHDWSPDAKACEKYMTIMKTRLTYNLLEIAA